MAHRPTLYIGIGGSGCKTVSRIKDNFREKYGPDKIPGYIRFFCIDTDICMDESLKDDTYIIGQEDYTPEGYLDFNIYNKTGLCDWYIDNQSSSKPDACGTGACRADGRLAMEASQKHILAKIRVIISELLDAAHNSGSVDIDVRFVLSLAGGTGSGIFIPLAMLISQFKAVNLYGYAILHGIYRKSDPGGPVYHRAFANSYASVLELDYLQHASVDNQIKMSVGGIDCILRAPLFKGFYMVEHLNNAGKIIQNVQDMYNVLALSMFSSSFESSKDTASENEEGIYDIKDKKGWLGSIGGCKIIFNGEKFAELYSKKVAHNIICDALKENKEDHLSLSDFFHYGSIGFINSDELTGSLRDYIGLTPPAALELSSRRPSSIDDEVYIYLKQKQKDISIDEEFVGKATFFRDYLSNAGSNANTALRYLNSLQSHCQRVRQKLSKEITDIEQKNNLSRVQINSYIFEEGHTLFGHVSLDVLRDIKTTAEEIAQEQQTILLKEYGVDMMNALFDLAEQHKKKIEAYKQGLHKAEMSLQYEIEYLEKNLSSSSSQFVYDATVMYWNEFEKDVIPDAFSINLLNYYLEADPSEMTNHLLQSINNLPSIIYHKQIPLESVIRHMSNDQYQAMMRFIRTSAIRMLMLDGRGYMINDQMAVDCMTRNIVISMYGDKKVPTVESDMEEIWKLWDNCQTNISWNKITDECFRQKAIIAVHEGNIIPYCVDAFYPDMVQKEYTEVIEGGKYNPHVDAILFERMQLASHSLKPMLATITPKDKEETASQTQNSRKLKSNGSKKRLVNVFIAGSKELRDERDLIRVELSKMTIVFNLDIRPHSFEDFKSSLKGQNGGRQADYNRFIRDKADVVVFIFDSKAGSITEEEFDVAYDSLAESNRPDIFVYGRNMSSDDHTLKKIKEKIFSYGQEYYVEYTSRDDLRYLFFKDMVSYFV